MLLYVTRFVAPATNNVAYKQVDLLINSRNVPLAMWYPTTISPETSDNIATYPYGISIRRIAKLLVGASFIPDFSFLKREFPIIPKPGADYQVVLDSSSERVQYEKQYPIVLACHGFLGSRFDLHHICADLASKGIIVVVPEMPESLSASYDTNWKSDDERITRDMINNRAIAFTREEFATTKQIGVLGHSLGTGAVVNYDTRDATSPRCAIAGFRGLSTVSLNSPLLVIASDNDSICPAGFIKERVKESKAQNKKIESLFFTDYNHISFLSKETNDGMVQFLSPLLPIAKSLGIPLLDFDKYSEAPDSVECGSVVIPTVTEFFTKYLKS